MFLRRHRERKTLLALDVVVVALVTAGIAGLAFGRPGGPPAVSVSGSLRQEPGPVAAVEGSSKARHAHVAVRPPIAVSVPALGIRSSLIRLGLNIDGTLEVPNDPSVAGWYRLGAKPGEAGPAVIVGHVDSQSGPGVFYRLGEAVPGERILVRTAGRTTLAFRVYAVREYAKTRFPTRLVYGQTPRSELRLVTCGGRFDEATGHYEDNIVLFARRA